MKVLVIVVFMLVTSCFAADHRQDRDRQDHRPDRSHPGLGYSPYWPQPTAYMPGHFESRTETILVVPEQVVRTWVEPVMVTRYDLSGKSYVEKVSDGYYRYVVVPARYESRVVQIWVPGYSVGPVYPIVPVGPSFYYINKNVSVGVGFRP